MNRELQEQADADYAARNTVSGEELRKRFGLTEATPPAQPRARPTADLVMPDSYDDPLPDFEASTPEGNSDA